jgi:hypothetical protein
MMKKSFFQKKKPTSFFEKNCLRGQTEKKKGKRKNRFLFFLFFISTQYSWLQIKNKKKKGTSEKLSLKTASTN